MTTTTVEVRRAFYAQRPRESRMVVAAPELRDDGGPEFQLVGYASVTDSPYAVTDWLGEYTEQIARGAFGKALQEAQDVRYLVNHDGIPLARTRSGTLTLREITNPLDDPQGRGQTGLWTEARVDATSPLAQTVRSAMSRGDLDEMSFAFQATRQEWNTDYTQRTVQEVRLFDVSVVTYPANPATSVQLNSARMAGVASRLHEGRALDPEDVNMLTQALGWLSAVDTIVDQAQDVLADYLKVPNLDDDDASDSEDMPSDGMDEMARANALAWAQARAHRAA